MSKKRRVILEGTPEELERQIPDAVLQEQIMRGREIGEFYGMPSTAFRSQRKYKPQIVLMFYEDWQKFKLRREQDPGKTRGEGRTSFRMMEWKNDEMITPAQVETVANRVKTLFGGTQPFLWKKGKLMFSYSDWDEGYQLQVLALNETEARRVIEQVLDVRQKSPDWKKAFRNENLETELRYKNNPGKVQVLGKQVDEPEERPLVDVEFAWAELHLHSLTKPIILYDLTGNKNDPVID